MSALRGRGSRSRIQRGRSRPTGEKRDSKPVESKLTQRIYQNQGVSHNPLHRLFHVIIVKLGS